MTDSITMSLDMVEATLRKAKVKTCQMAWKKSTGINNIPLRKRMETA